MLLSTGTEIYGGSNGNVYRIDVSDYNLRTITRVVVKFGALHASAEAEDETVALSAIADSDADTKVAFDQKGDILELYVRDDYIDASSTVDIFFQRKPTKALSLTDELDVPAEAESLLSLMVVERAYLKSGTFPPASLQVALLREADSLGIEDCIAGDEKSC